MATEKETLEAELAALRGENESLKKQAVGGGVGVITVKHGQKKGVVCVYGLQSRPVSLYEQQWIRLLEKKTVDQIMAFLVSERAAGNMPTDDEVLATKAAAKVIRDAEAAKNR